MCAQLYSRFVKLPATDEEWIAEATGFIENYAFPCVAAWDGFHVYLQTKLKNHYNFKNRYSITNMGLIGHNKRFLNIAVGALEVRMTHDYLGIF